MKAQAVFGLILLLILIIVVVGFIYYVDKITEDEEPLIGGCAGVAANQIQECCDNWAEENEIVHVACVGEWEIRDNKCAWKCGSG